MKRFWTKVAVDSCDGGFQVSLDGKPMRTPAGRGYVMPTLALAEAVAAEWAAVQDKVDPQQMPMTQCVATTLDVVPRQREAIVAQLADYAPTELLCYRADGPDPLTVRQQEIWQPLLDWAAQRFQAPLRVTAGIHPVMQNSLALENLRTAIEAFDDWRLVALQSAVTVSGSLVIGLALLERHIGAEEAFRAAELDSTFQIEQWGEDADAAQRRAGVMAELQTAEKLISTLAYT